MRLTHRQGLGKDAEEKLKVFLGAAANAKIATIHKIATPTTQRKDGSLVYTEASTVDFLGFLLDGSGRHVAMEAKRCEAASLPLSVITEGQWNYLSRAYLAGSVAILMVVKPEGPRTTFLEIDWSVVLSIDPKERKSIPLDHPRIRTVSPLSFLRPYLRTSEPPSPSAGRAAPQPPPHPCPRR